MFQKDWLTYLFTVKAKDAANNISALSNEVTIKTIDAVAPTAPILATPNPTSTTGTTINLTWQASTDNVGVVGYDIYKDGTFLATTVNTNYGVIGLIAPKSYKFKIKAKDLAGNVSESNEITVTPILVNAITATVNYDAYRKELSINGSASNGQDKQITILVKDPNGAIKYINQIISGTNGAFSFIFKINPTVVGAYTVSIGGDGITTPFINNFTINDLSTTDTTPPTAPTNLILSIRTGTTIDLSWGASTDNAGVVGYDVYKNGSFLATVVNTNYQVTDLLSTESYNFSVKAKDAVGNISASSNEIIVKTSDVVAPIAPIGLASSNITGTTADLSWTASTDNVGIVGYDIYKDGTYLATTTNINYKVIELSIATTYKFTIKAKDGAGNISDASIELAVTTLDTIPPTAPTNLVASGITGTTADLSWTASTDNVGVVGYNVINKPVKKIDHCGINQDLTTKPEKTEAYTYDGRGNMLTKTDRNGKTITYTYDVHNRMVAQSGEGLNIIQTFDSNGNKLTMSDESGITQRKYDELNRVLSKITPNVGTTSYIYDITQNLEAGYTAEKAIDPKNNITIKIYDKVGRIKEVKDSESTTPTVYTYYDNGSVQKVTYPDGASENYTYYGDNLLHTLTNKKPNGTTIDLYSYTYDGAHNQDSKTETINGVSKGTTNYTYDELNRLETVTEPSTKLIQYTYDKAGNRKTETITLNSESSSTTYNYNEQERLTSTVAIVGTIEKTVTYIYDNNGNMYSKASETLMTLNADAEEIQITQLGVTSEKDSAAIYEYDILNQLVRVYSGSSTIENIYNAEGLRVSKTVNGSKTYNLYEYDKMLLEVDKDGNQIARNVYGTNLLSRTVGGQKLNYLYNGHADVTALVGTDGTIVASYYYDAFGVPVEENGDISNPFRYAGYEYDGETGLYYLRARFYDASIARFMQEDTYRGTANDPLSLNLFTYCKNSPLVYFDPTGHAGTPLAFKDDTGYQHNYHTQAIFDALRNHPIRLGVDSTASKSNYLATVFQYMFNKVNSKFDLGYDDRLTVKGYAGQSTQKALKLYSDSRDITGYMKNGNPAFGATTFASLEYDYNIATGFPQALSKIIFDERRDTLGLARINQPFAKKFTIPDVTSLSAPNVEKEVAPQSNSNYSSSLDVNSDYTIPIVQATSIKVPTVTSVVIPNVVNAVAENQTTSYIGDTDKYYVATGEKYGEVSSKVQIDKDNTVETSLAIDKGTISLSVGNNGNGYSFNAGYSDKQQLILGGGGYSSTGNITNATNINFEINVKPIAYVVVLGGEVIMWAKTRTPIVNPSFILQK